MSNLQSDKLRKVEINLRGNSLDSNGTMNIAQSLKRFSNMEVFKLDTYFNNMKSVGVKPISLLIRKWKGLKTLYLNFDLNYIETEGGKLIGEGIKGLEEL